MYTKNISALVIACAFCFFVAQPASAYFTTKQTAVAVTPSTALYSIEYAFGLEDKDIYMPIIAERGLDHGSDEKKLGYTLREDGIEEIKHGKSVAVVFANAPIVDGMYKLEKGKAHTMTLVVVYTAGAQTQENEYAVQVDELPYYIASEDGTMQYLKLNPSELQYYITPTALLNEGIE